jgi:hypothetical protein
VARKTTKTEKKEKFEKMDDLEDGQRVKKTIIDKTTYVTQDEEDNETETIENSKNTQEFSYQHLKGKNNKNDLDQSTNDLESEDQQTARQNSTSSSSENIADYYKLQPRPSTSVKMIGQVDEEELGEIEPDGKLALTGNEYENEFKTNSQSKPLSKLKTVSSIKAKFEKKNNQAENTVSKKPASNKVNDMTSKIPTRLVQ